VLHINSLTQGVADVAGVAPFSKFILGLLENSVLFSKKNFNLKTPATPATTPIFPHFLPVFTCYTTCYTPATNTLVPATPPEYRTKRGPYFTIRGPYSLIRSSKAYHYYSMKL
jgi:hypothetical protein